MTVKIIIVLIIMASLFGFGAFSTDVGALIGKLLFGQNDLR